MRAPSGLADRGRLCTAVTRMLDQVNETMEYRFASLSREMPITGTDWIVSLKGNVVIALPQSPEALYGWFHTEVPGVPATFVVVEDDATVEVRFTTTVGSLSAGFATDT